MNITKPIVKAVGTFFYVGYLPLIPGTFGSLAGVFLFYSLGHDLFHYILLTLALTAAGFLVCGQAEEAFARKDSPHIVIDEVCGMLLSLFFVPKDPRFIIMAFILFRILDTLKPYPAERLQGIRGSLGVMSDDIVAGLYTNLVVQLVLRLNFLSGS